MWPFSQNKVETVVENNDIDCELINKLKAWRAIGETFDYLGRTMVVTRHYTVDTVYDYPFNSLRMKAGIHADYADNLGVIHHASFDRGESAALMQRQPEPCIKYRFTVSCDNVSTKYENFAKDSPDGP